MTSKNLFEKRDSQKIKQATICLLIRKEAAKTEILLAMKKRGFGAGFYNGPGGKPNKGETIESAAVREVKEEVGVDIQLSDLDKVAVLHFYFSEDKKDWDQDVHVFLVRKWTGDPKESEEMRPEWFQEKDFPYDHMWEDDPDWMPKVLAGRKIEAWFVFNGDQKITNKKIVEFK